MPNKLCITESGAFVFAALRCLPAGLLLLVVMAVAGRPLRPKAVGLTATVGILQLGAFTAFTSAALVTGGAGHTAMLANTWQFWLLPWRGCSSGADAGRPVLTAALDWGLVLIIEPWKLRGAQNLLTCRAVCFAEGRRGEGLGDAGYRPALRRGLVDRVRSIPWCSWRCWSQATVSTGRAPSCGLLRTPSLCRRPSVPSCGCTCSAPCRPISPASARSGHRW